MPVFPATQEEGQEDSKLRTRLGYIMRPCLKELITVTTTTTTKNPGCAYSAVAGLTSRGVCYRVLSKVFQKGSKGFSSK